MKSIKEADLKNKTVLLRASLDLPIKSGKILDNFRLKENLSTIKYLLKNKAKVLIIAHLGRPKKREKKYSLLPVAKQIKKFLKRKVLFLPDILAPEVKEKIKSLDYSQIVLFENIRFYEEETTNNFNFAKKLSELADLYINDDFSTSHREHASIEAITHYLPSFCGLSFEKEIRELSKIKDNPHHPFVVIIGGAKVSDKISVIFSLAQKADYILVGGVVANTLFKALRYKLGDSLVDDKSLKQASKIIHNESIEIILPQDLIIASSSDARSFQIIDVPPIPSTICLSPFGIFDIGPRTIIKWQDIIKTAKMIFWSGPLGNFEKKLFAEGTKAIARAISQNSGQTVVGGGDTLAAISHFKIKKFSHISPAGSAMLKYISGEELPGIKALNRKILR